MIAPWHTPRIRAHLAETKLMHANTEKRGLHKRLTTAFIKTIRRTIAVAPTTYHDDQMLEVNATLQLVASLS